MLDQVLMTSRFWINFVDTECENKFKKKSTMEVILNCQKKSVILDCSTSWIEATQVAPQMSFQTSSPEFTGSLPWWSCD